MAAEVAGRMWRRIAGWFASNATHVTVEFVPEAGEPLPAYGGYLRLWLVEGFLARRVEWGSTHFPALHGGVSLRFLGQDPLPFTMLTRPPGAWEAPGAQLDFPLTPLLPWSGGTVEVEAALYKASVAGPLATAAELVGGLAALMGPPLSTAAMIADKVSDGLNAVLAESGEQPELAVHWSMVSAGGGGNLLRPGYLAVANSPRERLGGDLSVGAGRLLLDDGSGPRQLAGVDFLLLRVECRAERDDWRFPELDELIRLAGDAYLQGQEETFRARRTEAVVRAWNSTDLTPTDRKRVAKLVADEIDAVRELGAVPGPAGALESVASARLVAPDAPELAELRLADLLA